jgi:hypothetical protein
MRGFREIWGFLSRYLHRRWLLLKHRFRFTIDNRRSIEGPGIVHRPIQETLADYYSSWIAREKWEYLY